ncbi:MAG: rRNA ((2251)-2-O)-methyltransferase RlmB [Cyanobacteriota bacterium]
MSPRFDRRRDQGQGSGAGQGRPPFRGPRPFRPRGEWRPDGPEREGRGERRESRGPRFDGPRPDAGRPEGARGGAGRFESPRPAGARAGGPRFDGPRSSAGRRGDPRREGPRADQRRGEGRRPFSSTSSEGRPPFRAGRPLGRPALGDGRVLSRRPDGDRDRSGPRSYGRDGRRDAPRPDSRPIAVEIPSGESERFQAGPADDLIWGRHAAQAALESERPIHRIWCTPELRFQPRFLQLLREAKSGGVLVEEVTWARLGQLTDGAVHQGIVLQVAAADTLDLGTLIDGCRSLGEPPLLMALDGITDPHNLGAIVRSAEALGAHGLVLPQRRSAGLTGSVAKVAAGALEHLPVARVVNLNRSLETLKQEGYRVIGLAGEGSVSLSEADLEGPLVIVTGSEGSGLSMLTRKHCDQLVRIPLRGATPSLNASVATAMVLYEVARRGWMKQITGAAPAPRIVRPQLPAPTPIADAAASTSAAVLTPAAPIDEPAAHPVATEAAPASTVDGEAPVPAQTPLGGDAITASPLAMATEPSLEGDPVQPVADEDGFAADIQL